MISTLLLEAGIIQCKIITYVKLIYSDPWGLAANGLRLVKPLNPPLERIRRSPSWTRVAPGFFFVGGLNRNFFSILRGDFGDNHGTLSKYRIEKNFKFLLIIENLKQCFRN